MSKLSIFQTQWIDLVFENRNKAYGAYQLRQESAQTGFKSLAITVSMVLSAYIILAVTSFFNPTISLPVPALPPTILEISDIHFPKEPEPPKQNSLPPAQAAAATPDQTNLARPNVVDQTQATAVVPENTSIAPTSISSSASTGSTIGTGVVPTTNTDVVPTVIDHGTTIISNDDLDKSPEFPGGINVFLNYVATNFHPAEELENTIKVSVSFVVEKDGSMSNIQVRNNPGYGMGDEAIRVLKSMKSKWRPGKKDGQNVRAYYNLPITIQL